MTMNDDNQLSRSNIKQYLSDLRDDQGKIKDILLQDGMYVMIINKWPSPLTFEISEAKTPPPSVEEKEPSLPVDDVEEPSLPINEEVEEPSLPVEEEVEEPSLPVDEEVEEPS